MKQITHISRRAEGKTWDVLVDHGDVLEIMTRRNIHRIIKKDAYIDPKRYPTNIPIYCFEDWVKEVKK